jgi:hypothetical protein
MSMTEPAKVVTTQADAESDSRQVNQLMQFGKIGIHGANPPMSAMLLRGIRESSAMFSAACFAAITNQWWRGRASIAR